MPTILNSYVYAETWYLKLCDWPINILANGIASFHPRARPETSKDHPFDDTNISATPSPPAPQHHIPYLGLCRLYSSVNRHILFFRTYNYIAPIRHLMSTYLCTPRYPRHIPPLYISKFPRSRRTCPPVLSNLLSSVSALCVALFCDFMQL